jgi:hypothetical protein
MHLKRKVINLSLRSLLIETNCNKRLQWFDPDEQKLIDVKCRLWKMVLLTLFISFWRWIRHLKYFNIIQNSANLHSLTYISSNLTKIQHFKNQNPLFLVYQNNCEYFKSKQTTFLDRKLKTPQKSSIPRGPSLRNLVHTYVHCCKRKKVYHPRRERKAGKC